MICIIKEILRPACLSASVLVGMTQIRDTRSRCLATFCAIRAAAEVKRSIMFHVLARHAARLGKEAGRHFR